jgi:hypothetical protein
MRYQIQRVPLVVGGDTIAPGVIVDTDDQTTLAGRLMRDKTPPPDALALDYEALAAMRLAYPNAQLFSDGLDEETALEIAVPIRQLRAQQAEQRKVEAAMVMLDEVNRQIAAAQAELAALKAQTAELKKIRDNVTGEMKCIQERLEVR